MKRNIANPDNLEALVVMVPRGTKSSFKSACSLRKRSMRDEIETFVDLYIKNPRILEELK